MNLDVIASTKAGYKADKEELDRFGGISAGVCYSANGFESLLNEPQEKTMARVERTKTSGHHSVFGHGEVSLVIEGVPKALAMFLNNEKEYNTSERSARYTKMAMTDEEEALYEKWMAIFTEKIKARYAGVAPEFFTERKIKTLAQENARYLISVFTRTTLEYTTSYRQLNYLYGFMQKEIARENPTEFDKMLRPHFAEFCEKLEALNLVDERLAENGKGREFSLIDRGNAPVTKYYGDVYSTSYDASFAYLAQAQRHRTIDYSFKFDGEKFFVPPILKDDKNLVAEWLKDCHSRYFPQGMLLKVEERGTYKNFILKMQERLCSCAQLEINQKTLEVLKEYTTALRASNHPKYEELKEFQGSRCTFPNNYRYNCTTPCHFKDGVTGEREI